MSKNFADKAVFFTKGQQGFTLIELLLAMAISVFVAAVAYQGLTVAISASESVETRTRRLGEVQLALDVLEQDVRQIINRPVRNELGILEPVLAGGADPASLLLFTRAGWGNPQGLRRSELARINYRLQGDELWRQRWLSVDRISLEDGLQQVMLLDGIDSIRIAFFNPYTGAGGERDGSLPGGIGAGLAGPQGDWVFDWRSEQLGLNAVEPLPAAIRITMTLNDFGEVSRVFAIPGA